MLAQPNLSPPQSQCPVPQFCLLPASPSVPPTSHLARACQRATSRTPRTSASPDNPPITPQPLPRLPAIYTPPRLARLPGRPFSYCALPRPSSIDGDHRRCAHEFRDFFSFAIFHVLLLLSTLIPSSTLLLPDFPSSFPSIIISSTDPPDSRTTRQSRIFQLSRATGRVTVNVDLDDDERENCELLVETYCVVFQCILADARRSRWPRGCCAVLLVAFAVGRREVMLFVANYSVIKRGVGVYSTSMHRRIVKKSCPRAAITS